MGKHMVAVVSDGTNLLGNYSSGTPSEDELLNPQYYSYMTITPFTSGYGADFSSLRYYNKDEISTARYVHAISPMTDFACMGSDCAINKDGMTPQLYMSDMFTQSASESFAGLRDYMYMYGTGELVNGSTSIRFNHIPAILRFVITNRRAADTGIQSISVRTRNAGPIGSKSVQLKALATDANVTLVYSGTNDIVCTELVGEDTKLSPGNQYVAYAMAFPLGTQGDFTNDEIQFIVNTADNEQLDFSLLAEDLAVANRKYGDNIYDWVGGKSYTVRMNLNDALTIDGITVSDWTEVEVDESEDAACTSCYVELRGDVLMYCSKHSPAKDIIIHFKPCMNNELVTFTNVGLADN
ncbi:MAG: fimbrillin family protein, partial [Bacteroidaceae bacterium]|nr:fimbrillin family protein [Bacteroidaceae bacterium]